MRVLASWKVTGTFLNSPAYVSLDAANLLRRHRFKLSSGGVFMSELSNRLAAVPQSLWPLRFCSRP
jgi:hypothetical protein